MCAKEAKIGKTLDREALPGLFEALAGWARGAGELPELPPLPDISTLKVRVEMEDQACSVRIKTKRRERTGAEARPEGIHPPLGYKALKKKMRGDMKRLEWYVSESRLPPTHELEGFLGHALAMTRFPGKGDEHYPRFVAALTVLREAVASQDLSAFAAALGHLSQVKKECHAKYK